MTESREMPLYTCHKKVRAAKIEAISPVFTKALFKEGGGEREYIRDGMDIYLAKCGQCGRSMHVRVSEEYRLKHNPEAGGYYVVYKDGYTSFSPAKAFEEGYTRDE